MTENMYKYTIRYYTGKLSGVRIVEASNDKDAIVAVRLWLQDQIDIIYRDEYKIVTKIKNNP